MIRYQHVTTLFPPAPFVTLTLRCPATSREAVGLPAQVDTAADRTIVPDTVVAALGLVADGRATFQGFGSQLVQLPPYLVAVTVHDLPTVLVQSALGEREPYVLLGRDVLNKLQLLLDGPQLALEIG